jgi:hypothetical protein
MTKARDLADLISAGNPLADGAIDVSEVTGAAPTASPTFTGTVTLPGATSTADITLGDNNKAIFGAGSDLQIYHNGSNSYIDDTGTGGLILRASSDIYLGNLSGETYIRAIENGSVQLRYDNATKLATTSTGVDVTGELIADSYNETYAALSGTTPTVNCESGNVFSLTTSGNTTFTFSNPPASGTAYGFMLRLTAGGTHTITYPASVDWAGATAPDAPASGETDVLVFTTTDGGTTWYGALAIDAAG